MEAIALPHPSSNLRTVTGKTRLPNPGHATTGRNVAPGLNGSAKIARNSGMTAANLVRIGWIRATRMNGMSQEIEANARIRLTGTNDPIPEIEANDRIQVTGTNGMSQEIEASVPNKRTVTIEASNARSKETGTIEVIATIAVTATTETTETTAVAGMTAVTAATGVETKGAAASTKAAPGIWRITMPDGRNSRG